jgi:peptidylprolyl isomerase
MTKLTLTFLPALLFIISCRNHPAPEKTINRDFETNTTSPPRIPTDAFLIEISTSFGKMKAILYNETPAHRDNMIRLIEKGFYDSLLFHRIIKNFVIQGGDPDSRNAAPGVLLGDGGNGTTLPAEFFPGKLFHKKGALAAARDGDDVNPQKRSSDCQFYIVQGKIHDDASLEKNERRINRDIVKKISDSLLALPQQKNLKLTLERVKSDPRNSDSLAIVQKKIDSLVIPVYRNYPKYSIPEAQKNVYKKMGGTPHLDTHYTVFGEVVEGLDVLDALILSETDSNDRPKKDIRMSIKILQRPSN